MVNYWEDWEQYPYECPCGWAGTLGEGIQNFDSMYVTEVDCPSCKGRLKNITNSATDEMIKKFAEAGSKRATEYFAEQAKRYVVKTELHDLGLERLQPLPFGTPPVVQGYETIAQKDIFNHPALVGLKSWVEDYNGHDQIYAGYSLPVPSPIEEEALKNIVFIYQDNPSGLWIEKYGTVSSFSNGRSVTWFSENKQQTHRFRPAVPVAFLVKSPEVVTPENLQIYSFTIQDKNPEYLTFGCTAPSLDVAENKARKAGYKEFTLIDVREPTGVELSDVANLELISNPLLGEEWLPLVSALEAALSRMKVGSSWSMDFMGKAYNYDLSDAPYTQGVLEGDGSLHLEIGPTYLVEKCSDNQQQVLKFLGWNPPIEGLPNYFRTFEPGWNPRHVAYVFLQTISLNFDIGTADLFTFGGNLMGTFDPEGLMDHLSQKDGRLAFGDAWGFWGKHPFSS